MERLVMTLDEDELLGLQALAKVNPPSDGQAEGASTIAALVMREGLVSRLEQAGLPWAPSAALVEEHLRESRVVGALDEGDTSRDAHAAWTTSGENPAPDAAPTSRPRSSLASFWGNSRARTATCGALAMVTLVLLLGGYVAKWGWTGFESNDQVWDWLTLLLLPVAFATLPIWLEFGQHMSSARKTALLVAILAFAAFVVAGYLVPISWTGFSGNTLWDWLTLIVLPVTLITIRAWPTSPREIRRIHVVVASLLGIAAVITLVGGYAGTWKWTGYPGNTLWDWLQLLLAPLVVGTILVPASARMLSGDAARLAAAAVEREKATARARRELQARGGETRSSS
jgi:uncharacterized membrane protein